MFPLRQGRAEAFAAVREFLEQSGYSELNLLSGLEAQNLHSLLFPYGLRRKSLDTLYRRDGMALARLFLGGYTEQPFLPQAVLEACHELGLVEVAPGGIRAPVVLYPALGFFVAADRPMYSDGSRAYQGTDYVMSGAEVLCRTYVDAIPRTPCRTFLDVGCGSGLAALLASRFAGQVWATDITPRATAFAEFNRRLNGVENMNVLTGDLFAPIGALTFERIASNPPFEPPLKQNLIFSVGGEDGEAILAKLVSEAPAYLAPGGRLFCLVSGTDRLRESFDQRARRWLGKWSEECDLALFVNQKMTPREYAIEQILGDNADSWKIEEWSRFYQNLEAVRVITGFLVIQRRASGRPVFHARFDLGEGAGPDEMATLLDWETRCTEPRFLLDARLGAAPGWQLHVRHEFDSGSLNAKEFALKRSHPFAVELECGPSLPHLLCRCDGTLTGSELFELVQAQDDDALPAFLRSLGELVSAGFLKLASER